MRRRRRIEMEGIVMTIFKEDLMDALVIGVMRSLEREMGGWGGVGF